MRLLFMYLLLLPAVGWAQEKALTKAVSNAKSAGKADSFQNLFTANGTTQAVSNALDTTQRIQNLTLNTATLNSICSKKHELLEISLPSAEGTLELELVPSTVIAPDFKVTFKGPTPNVTPDVSKLQFYHGIIKGNPNSLVAFTFAPERVTGLIVDNSGNRVLTKKQGKTDIDNSYAFYNEKAVATKISAFNCGHNDDSAESYAEAINKGARDKSTACIKDITVFLEVDYFLRQHWEGDTGALTDYLLDLFNIIIAIYKNEDVKVKVGQIRFAGEPNPAYNYSNIAIFLDSFANVWHPFGDDFPGDVALNLTNISVPFTTGGSGAYGMAYLGGISRKYQISGGRHNGSAFGTASGLQSFYAYSDDAIYVAHELGHSFGSRHTHWCGWSGGAIDNCNSPDENGHPVSPEPYPDGGTPCPPGPRPGYNQGTIMSYCHTQEGIGIDMRNGFGPQPGAKIRTYLAAVDRISTITIDGNAESTTSGNWASSSTWSCGTLPSVTRKVTIGNGNAVQLQGSGTASNILDIKGSFDLSTTNSVLNINNN